MLSNEQLTILKEETIVDIQKMFNLRFIFKKTKNGYEFMTDYNKIITIKDFLVLYTKGDDKQYQTFNVMFTDSLIDEIKQLDTSIRTYDAKLLATDILSSLAKVTLEHISPIPDYINCLKNIKTVKGFDASMFYDHLDKLVFGTSTLFSKQLGDELFEVKIPNYSNYFLDIKACRQISKVFGELDSIKFILVESYKDILMVKNINGLTDDERSDIITGILTNIIGFKMVPFIFYTQYEDFKAGVMDENDKVIDDEIKNEVLTMINKTFEECYKTFGGSGYVDCGDVVFH